MTLLRQIDWNKSNYSDAMRQITKLALAKRADSINDAVNSAIPESVRPHLSVGLLGAGVGGLAGLIRSSRRKDPRYLRDMLVGAGLGGTLAGAGSYGLGILANKKQEQQNAEDALQGFQGSIKYDPQTGKLSYEEPSYVIDKSETDMAKNLEERGVPPVKIKETVTPFIAKRNRAINEVAGWKNYLKHMQELDSSRQNADGISQATKALSEAEANLSKIENEGKRLTDSIAMDIRRRSDSLPWTTRVMENLSDIVKDPFPQTEREAYVDLLGGGGNVYRKNFFGNKFVPAVAAKGKVKASPAHVVDGWAKGVFTPAAAARTATTKQLEAGLKVRPGWKGNLAAFLAPAAIRNVLKATLPSETYSYLSGEVMPSGVSGRDYSNAANAVNTQRTVKE